MSALESPTENDELSLEPGAHTDQFLTFIMADEEYGVDILSVQEIRGWEPATAIPNAPEYMKGVINLRGTIVPIIDLRQRFHLPEQEYSRITVVIVLKIPTKRGERVTGIVVDAVSDVYSLSGDEMKAPPDVGGHENTSYIKGLISVNEKMVILLDLEKLLDLDELPDVQGETN